MQIHEITLKPRTDEGILKGISSAVGSALTRAANNYLGTAPAAPNPYVDRSAEIRKMAQPLAAGLAQTQFKNWNAALAQYGVDNPAKLDEKTQQALKTSIIRNANKTFGVYNLLNFSRNIEPAYRQDAAEAEKNIADIVDDLMNKPGQQTQQDWNNFVNNAQQASVLTRMYSGTGSDPRNVEVNFDGKTYSTADRELDPKDPADAKIIQQAVTNKRLKTTTAPTTTPPTPTAEPPAKDEIQVRPGKRLKISIPQTGAVYYKTAAGWINELGIKIEDPNSITRLEQYADAGYGREEKIAPVIKPAPSKTARKRRGKQRVR
jgi:hypothetical protein